MQQALSCVFDPLVDDRVQQCSERVADDPAVGIAQLFQVAAVDREVFERQAWMFGENLFRLLLRQRHRRQLFRAAVIRLGGDIRALHLKQAAHLHFAELLQHALDLTGAAVKADIVPQDQLQAILGEPVRAAQPPQNRLRQRGADLLVSLEVVDAVGIRRARTRLADVVQQHRHPQQRLRFDRADRADDMPPDVAAVVFVDLPDAEGLGKLGDDRRDHVAEFIERLRHLRAAEHAQQLLAHALAGDPVEQARVAVQCLRRLPLRLKAVNGGKTHAAQNAQGVLAEAVIGNADAAQHAAPQILSAPEGVLQAALVVVRHGVDREVAARQVAREIVGEGHALGAAAVGIDPVDAVGGHLKRLAVRHHHQRAVLQPVVVGLIAAEHRAQRIGLRVGADVPVVRLQPHQGVAHTAADGIRRKAVLLQEVDDLVGFRFDLYVQSITFSS